MCGVESEVAGVGKMQQEAEAGSRVAKSAAGTRGVSRKGPRPRPRGGADGLMTPQTAAFLISKNARLARWRRSWRDLRQARRLKPKGIDLCLNERSNCPVEMLSMAKQKLGSSLEGGEILRVAEPQGSSPKGGAIFGRVKPFLSPRLRASGGRSPGLSLAGFADIPCPSSLMCGRSHVHRRRRPLSIVFSGSSLPVIANPASIQGLSCR